MHTLLDLNRYPLDRLDSGDGAALVDVCRRSLDRVGLCDLPGFMHPGAAERVAADLVARAAEAAFTHSRDHNIYFRDNIPGLAPDHPALTRFTTVNHTLCADQLADSPVVAIYEWPPLRRFLAAILGKPRLHLMQDPLARVNVMTYGAGEALNWHFDRSEFTTTLLLQAPDDGGDFEYRTGLRSDDDPNHAGVARLLRGEDEDVRRQCLTAGTLTIFRGKNTPHRTTPVHGDRLRVISVFSYYEQPGVRFTTEEQMGFYGRVA